MLKKVLSTVPRRKFALRVVLRKSVRMVLRGSTYGRNRCLCVGWVELKDSSFAVNSSGLQLVAQLLRLLLCPIWLMGLLVLANRHCHCA